MKPSLFAAAFLFDDTPPAPRNERAEDKRPDRDRAPFLANACQDDPALRFRLADRAAFLERVCRNDPELRSRVEALLAADLAAESFSETPPPAPDALPPATDSRGT